MPQLHFEDFAVGDRARYGDLTVSREDIVAFAREWDAQDFHLDEAAAARSLAGGLIASGWHGCALLMRLVADGFILRAASMGAPGVDEVKWLRPIRPRDRLGATHEVIEKRASRSRPEMGLVRFRFTLANQHGEALLEQTNWIMLGRRGERARVGAPVRPDVSREPDKPLPLPPAQPLPFLEDLVPGETTLFGTHVFSAEEIIRFARAYDPQSFHVDPEAAVQSAFGGLAASGWHTAAAWMRCLTHHAAHARARAKEADVPCALLGPSPGFTNLKWLAPVRPGDVLRYGGTISATRPSRSRPGWGLAFHHNFGENQHGERVFSFDGCVFWQMRPS